jgi:3-oxoacyl-[acyl-carrier protein] reductase
VYIRQADVSDYAQVRSMTADILERYGRIDVLVNNAGVTRDGFLMLMSEKDWAGVVDVNLNGTFHCSKAVSENMISRREGVIINVSSLSGITGLAGQTNYAAAKGALHAITRSLARELGSRGITVNCVSPGLIDTASSAHAFDDAAIRRIVPLQRAGTADDVAHAVGFLASDAAAYITGQILPVNGGMT